MSELEDRQRLLARSFLFSCQTNDAVAELARMAKRFTVPAGTVVFSKGEPGQRMYAIVAGNIKIGTVSDMGREIVFGLLGPSEFFGELSLLDGHARSATATALSRTELLAIERRDFLAGLERHPRFATDLLQALARRMRSIDTFIEDGAFLSLSARLAKYLARLAREFGTPAAQGVRIGIRLSQQEIANLVGASRESVNKLMRLWTQAGLIGRDGSHVVVIDAEQLEAFEKCGNVAGM